MVISRTRTVSRAPSVFDRVPPASVVRAMTPVRMPTRPTVTMTSRPTVRMTLRPVIGSSLTRATGGIAAAVPTVAAGMPLERGSATPTSTGGGISLGTFGGDIGSIGGDLMAKGRELLPVAIKIGLVFVGLKIVLWLVRGRR